MEKAIRNKELEITSPAHRRRFHECGGRGDKLQVRTLCRAPLFLFAYEGNNLQK